MTVRPHFYLLRMRNSSLPELACRLRQSIVLPYLNLLKILGRQSPGVPEIKADAIANLIMPDLFLAEATSFSNGNAIPESISSTTVALNKQQTGNLPKADPASEEVDIRLIWEPVRLQQAVLLLVVEHQKRNPPVGNRPNRLQKPLSSPGLKPTLSPVGCTIRRPWSVPCEFPYF